MKALNTKILIFLMTLTCTSIAQAKNVAKAIIVRGSVVSVLNGQEKKLKRGQWLEEGAVVKTSEKSFAKFIFMDKSQMNLGPKSEMEISAFKKEEAGIITLVKGQLRSKVTKDYMKIKEKNKSKLFIKTKSAAMGVRGTDFLVKFNPINERTALITFEGSVAIARLENGLERFNQTSLERVVSNPDAVLVKRGQFSGANPDNAKVSPPIKINPAQLKTLEKNDSFKANEGKDQSKSENKAPGKVKATFKSPLPPGIDGKLFTNEAKELDKQMETSLGSKAQVVFKEVQKEIEVLNSAPVAETDIRAGGFIDINTGLYIEPPKESTFDPVAGVYIPPSSYGTFDPSTGEYKNENYDLNPDGSFSAKEGDDGRGPASEGDNPPPPPPPANEYDNNSEDFNQDGTQEFDEEAANQRQEEIEQDRQDSLDEQGTNQGFSTLEVNFNTSN